MFSEDKKGWREFPSATATGKFSPILDYRIKPERLKFKKGDTVKASENYFGKSNYAKVYQKD